jgi:serine/threonine protein kinase
MPLSPGQVLNNRYRIVALLKQGGFGAVYKAWDLNLKGPCAVKENFKLEPAEQQQFEREASLLFKLHHPNLPRVFDQFSLPGDGQFLVMDYVEGQDLAEVILSAGGPLPEKTAVAWLLQVCGALTYLHSQTPPVIHRDIKPNNIKITPTGQAILVDFGIAKTGITGKNTTEAARGVTPGYSPPEQYGRGQTNPRTDIYALGATLYALLTGQEPPPSTDRVAGVPLQPPRHLNQSISPALEKIILKAMAIQANQRYTSAEEFKAALLSYATKSDRPPWLWATVASSVIIFGVIAAIVGWVIWGPIPPGRFSQRTEEGIVFPTTISPATVIPVEAENTPQNSPGQSGPNATKASDTPFIPSSTVTQTATVTPVSTWRQGRFAFIARSGNGTRMYMVDLASGNEPRIIFDPSADVILLGPAWSPDGSHIAVAQYGGPLYNFQASTMSLNWTNSDCDVPSWSPDGTRIVCVTRGTGIFNILDASTGNRLESYSLDSGAVHPTWSPTADELIYSVLNGTQTSIWRASLGAGALPVLLAGDASENYAPSWSPDGQWIAFQSTLGSPLSDLWIMDRNGSSLRRVLYTGSSYWSRAPSFSPDGHWLAFVSNQAGSYGADYGEIFVVSLNTGELVQVTHTGGMVYDWRVDWGP